MGIEAAVLRVVVMVALPTVVIAGGDFLIERLSGRAEARQTRNENSSPPKGLGMRFGYDVSTVSTYWGALGDACKTERRFLEIDLLFPIFYCAAFAASLFIGWAALGRPFRPGWLLAPVIGTALADWAENLIQLSQLDRFAADGLAGLDPRWIRIASGATMLKLLLMMAMILGVLSLAVFLLSRALRSSAS